MLNGSRDSSANKALSIMYSFPLLALVFEPRLLVIPGGSCDECTYMSGIIFRKTGTNKQMPREIINPKIMVSELAMSLAQQSNGCVIYDRVEWNCIDLTPLPPL